MEFRQARPFLVAGSGVTLLLDMANHHLCCSAAMAIAGRSRRLRRVCNEPNRICSLEFQ